MSESEVPMAYLYKTKVKKSFGGIEREFEFERVKRGKLHKDDKHWGMRSSLKLREELLKDKVKGF